MPARKYFLLMFFLANMLLAFGQTSTKKEKLFIPDGKVAIIGYGSLMSRISMERTLGHLYNDKFLPVHIKGFERVWNFAFPNDGSNRPDLFYYIVSGDTIFPKKIVFLNIQENRSKSMNACLFLIDTVELKMFDDRENGYSRIKVNDKIKEFEVVNGNVYAYKALPAFAVKVTDNPKDNVISRGYIKTVEEDALLALGQQFRDEYYESTVPYSPKIVITRNVKQLRK